MEEEKKTDLEQESQTKEVEQTENQPSVEDKNPILKPTISSEDIILNKRPNSSIQIAKRVEQYNFRQGFRTVKSNSDIKIFEETQTENKQVYIKPPRKKINVLPVLLILLLFGAIGGAGYLYTKGYFNKVTDSASPQEEVEEVKVEIKDINYRCVYKEVNADYFYNSILENLYYTKDNKLIKKEEYNTIQYYNERPSYLSESCPKVAEKYEKYEGYSKECYMQDNLSITEKTTVDLEVLEESELTFDLDYEEKVVIEEKLNDDIFTYLEEMKTKGYTCEQIE